MSDRRPLISVVAPCHNEAPNLEPLHEAVTSHLGSREWEYELVFVDDGSTDGSWPTICRIAEADRRVHGVRLTRSFGQQAAILAGLRLARGDAVVTMDADLQHPPAVIPALVQHWLAGTPVVLTHRSDSADVGAFKRATSAMFYWIFSTLTGVPMTTGTGEFRLMDRRVVDYLLELQEGEYFLRGLIGWAGFGSVTVPFDAAPHVWAEQALDIAERPATTTADVQQARLQIETRRWLTAVFNREEFSEKQQHEVALDFGAMHLAALRARAARPQLQPLPVEIVSVSTVPALLGSGEPQEE